MSAQNLFRLELSDLNCQNYSPEVGESIPNVDVKIWQKTKIWVTCKKARVRGMAGDLSRPQWQTCSFPNLSFFSFLLTSFLSSHACLRLVERLEVVSSGLFSLSLLSSDLSRSGGGSVPRVAACSVCSARSKSSFVTPCNDKYPKIRSWKADNFLNWLHFD